MEYPKKHKQIVKEMLGGRFLLQNEGFYEIVSDNLEFYKDFFEKSFGYEVAKTSEVIYLTFKDTNESFSQKLMLVLGVLVDFINQNGRDLHEEIFKTYDISEIEDIIKNSSYKKVCRKIDIPSFIKNSCQKRNIVKYDILNDNFYFTSAVNIFLDFAREIAKKSKISF